ncbi:hypothetical protein CDAR_424301 [Caerostris darwini]|uniref:Complexin n=1 Tax=Caerostris darwini TaxID=1538125 RepID=A0AAV4T0E5_9ARAC|nr:hypothetical protein CDAR_424301 [Caerostris darwini]
MQSILPGTAVPGISSPLDMHARARLRAVGNEEEGTSEDKDAADEEEQERLEALREAEERRKEKHRKMEEEREKMRQEIRDKVGGPLPPLVFSSFHLPCGEKQHPPSNTFSSIYVSKCPDS